MGPRLPVGSMQAWHPCGRQGRCIRILGPLLCSALLHLLLEQSIARLLGILGLLDRLDLVLESRAQLLRIRLPILLKLETLAAILLRTECRKW